MAQQDNMWQQVAAPQIWGATDGYREMGNLFGQANQSIQGGLDAFKEEQTKNANNELLRRVSSLGDPDAIRQGLSDGSLLQGLHTSRLGSNIYGDINNLGSSYLNQQNTKANTLGTNQLNEERGYNFGNVKDANSYMSDPNNRANYDDALKKGDSSLLASNTPVNLVNNFYANAQQGQSVLSSLNKNSTEGINLDELKKRTGIANATDALTKALYGKSPQEQIGLLNAAVNNPNTSSEEKLAALNWLKSINDNSNVKVNPNTSSINLNAPVGNDDDRRVSEMYSGKTGKGSGLYGQALRDVVTAQGSQIKSQSDPNAPMTPDGHGNMVKATSALGYLQLTKAANLEAIKLNPSLADKPWNGATIGEIGLTLFNHAQSLNKGNDTSKGDAYLRMLWGDNIKAGDSAGNAKEVLNRISKHESGSILYNDDNNSNTTPLTLADDFNKHQIDNMADTNRFDSLMKTSESNTPSSYGNRLDVFNDLKKAVPTVDQNTFNKLYNAMDQKYGKNIDNALKPTVFGNAIKQSMGTSTSKIAQHLLGTDSYGGGLNVSIDGNMDKIISDINKQASGSNNNNLVNSYKKDKEVLGQLNDQVTTAANNISATQNDPTMPYDQKKATLDKAIVVYKNARDAYKKYAANMNNTYGGVNNTGTNKNNNKGKAENPSNVVKRVVNTGSSFTSNDGVRNPSNPFQKYIYRKG